MYGGFSMEFTSYIPSSQANIIEMKKFFSLFKSTMSKEKVDKEINRFLLEIHNQHPGIYHQIVKIGEDQELLPDYKNAFIKLSMFVYFYPFAVKEDDMILDTQIRIGNEVRGIDLYLRSREHDIDMIGLVFSDEEEIEFWVKRGYVVVSIGPKLGVLLQQYVILHDRFMNEDVYMIMSRETDHKIKNQHELPLWYMLKN